MNSRESEVRERTGEAFKGHVVTELHNSGMYRSWHCGRPGDCSDSFTVTTIPGHLFVTGDIGNLIVSRCEDMISWCRGAVDSTPYFAEKVPKCIQIKEFSTEACREWLMDLRIQFETEADDEDDEQEAIDSLQQEAIDSLLTIDEALDALDDDIGEKEFLELTENLWVDEIPTVRDYTREFLRCRDAVRWLIRKLDAGEV